YKKSDALSDKDLQSQSQYYKQLRDQGLDEKTARMEFNTELRGSVGALNALMGAAVGVVGPAGQIARGLKGGTAAIGAGERGILGRAGAGAAEGGVGMGAQGGVMDASVQSALMNNGL